MTLPCSPNPISFDNIQTEFGGSHPISLTEYYSRAAGIPASGEISASHFRCKSAYIPGSLTYSTPQTISVPFTGPYGVSSVNVIVVGGGGGGGYSHGVSYSASGGGGGGGWRGTIPTTPGASYTLDITVGVGGTPGVEDGLGGAGGGSSITLNGVTRYGSGGLGGADPDAITPAPGGTGGAGSGGNGSFGENGSSVIDTNANGGAGGDSYYTVEFGTATGGAGGLYPSGSGAAGTIGGGGGGASEMSGGSDWGVGGAGGAGYIRIWW